MRWEGSSVLDGAVLFRFVPGLLMKPVIFGMADFGVEACSSFHTNSESPRPVHLETCYERCCQEKHGRAARAVGQVSNI